MKVLHNQRKNAFLPRRRTLIMLNKKLEYFVTLSQCLSFTQAAAAHSVSQTAISQYIAALENKLQVR